MILPVNQAMAGHRPAKAVVRSWWVDAARDGKALAVALDVPMYLTLPGQEGYDVAAMIQAGLVSTNESGGISDEDSRLIVGYEKNLPTLSSLKAKIPGLAVRPTSVADALGGSAPEAAPSSKVTRNDFRAAVVNLDLNQTIKPDRGGNFEVAQLVNKIGLLHLGTVDRSAVSPWTLCVTLHGEFRGDASFNEGQIASIVDACTVSSFARLVKDRAPWIDDCYVVTIERDPVRIQIAVLMVMCVHVVEGLSAQGWAPTFRRAGYYQHDSPGFAPMVTLVVDLEFVGTGRRAHSRQEGYQSLAAAWCWVDATGSVQN